MRRIAIIGAGPAGLMAADAVVEAMHGAGRDLAASGVQIDIYDAMPSFGRKFLMAGKGGMNITHSEPLAEFKTRYGSRQTEIAALLDQFDPQQLCDWIHALGIDTFVGSSGRVFPTAMKAAPLLRAWLHRLRQHGVRFHVRHRWLGWTATGAHRFATPQGELQVDADASVLALGGASWARLGSDGRWRELLLALAVPVAAFKPSNCGFDIGWSSHFRQRFAGQPVKPVLASFAQQARRGELMITESGIEGGLVYALSAPLRDALAVAQPALLYLDLAPDRDMARLVSELAKPRGRDSLAKHLRKRAGIEGVKAGLLRELCPQVLQGAPTQLAAAIKALALPLRAPRPIDEAISTAGGVCFEALNAQLMLDQLPGVFCAGEMLDWEAPTGGYLLTACLSSGRAAGRAAAQWLQRADI